MGLGGDAGADHFWDIRPAVNVLAEANPDKDCSKPRSSMAGSRSPDSDPKEGEANPESSRQNLGPSAFICGSLLHGCG